METVERNGLLLSRTEQARQVLIFAHGDFGESCLCGLFAGDGHTSVPDGPDVGLFFYTDHGTAERGFNVLQEVMRQPQEAFDGLHPRAAMTRERALELTKNGEMLPQGALGHNVRARGMKGAGAQVRNYALYHHESAEEKVDKHQSGEYGTTDVDILIVTTSERRYLADVFALCDDYHYQRYHFCACRVRR